MRPLDQKLKYQIDKLLRTAVTGSLGKTGFLLVCSELPADLYFNRDLTRNV